MFFFVSFFHVRERARVLYIKWAFVFACGAWVPCGNWIDNSVFNFLTNYYNRIDIHYFTAHTHDIEYIIRQFSIFVILYLMYIKNNFTLPGVFFNISHTNKWGWAPLAPRCRRFIHLYIYIYSADNLFVLK